MGSQGDWELLALTSLHGTAGADLDLTSLAQIFGLVRGRHFYTTEAASRDFEVADELSRFRLFAHLEDLGEITFTEATIEVVSCLEDVLYFYDTLRRHRR